MNRAENSDPIPMDLILEILSRLPSKSVGRFHCVSKQWRSMLSGPYFTELYLTRSSARPRLLFAVYPRGEVQFYSSPHPQIPHDKSALVVTADFHSRFRLDTCSYASGLICFPGLFSPKERRDAMLMICNPITGEYANLPKLIDLPDETMYAGAVLGFDPVEKQFKVLVANYISRSRTDHKILTLGGRTLSWRSKIDCPSYNYSPSRRICINGVLYYLAYDKFDKTVVCFDVRSEEFRVIKAECLCDHYEYSPTSLINYKGKLCGICWKFNGKADGPIELCMCVLHDVETQEWSKHVYTLPENEAISLHKYSIAGMTTRGEIVLSMIYTFKPFYVFYFNPEKNTLRSVEIQCFGENVGRVEVFVDHVEDFNLLK